MAVPINDIVPVQSVEGIVAGVSENGVVEVVARSADGVGASQTKNFHISRKRVVRRRGDDGIPSLPGSLENDIVVLVHKVGVVARTPDHGVPTGTSVERVIEWSSGEQVVGVVAAKIDTGRGCAKESEGLDIGIKGQIDKRRVGENGIETSPGEFNDHIQGIAKNVGIIAGTTDEGVADRVATTIQNVVALVADDGVCLEIAGEREVAGPGGGDEVLDEAMVFEREGNAGQNRVVAAEVLDSDILAEDGEGVVPIGSDQPVALAALLDDDTVALGENDAAFDAGVGAELAGETGVGVSGGAAFYHAGALVGGTAASVPFGAVSGPAPAPAPRLAGGFDSDKRVAEVNPGLDALFVGGSSFDSQNPVCKDGTFVAGGLDRAENRIEKMADFLEQHGGNFIRRAVGGEENPVQVAAVAPPEAGHVAGSEGRDRRENGKIAGAERVKEAIGGDPVQGTAEGCFEIGLGRRAGSP